MAGRFGAWPKTALLFLALAAPAAAQDTSMPMSGLQLSGDEPIQIESDRLDVRDKENQAIFTGNVAVVQGKSLLKASRMVVFYANNDDKAAAAAKTAIDRLEFSGTVYLQSEDQVATGDEGAFDMKTSVFTLSGKQVVLTQGESVIVGCKLTANTKLGTAKVEGCPKAGGSGNRIQMVLKPGAQTQ